MAGSNNSKMWRRTVLITSILIFLGFGIVVLNLIRWQEDYKRYYPYGSTASTVLGFTGTDNQGLAGLETQYDDVLSGTSGRMVSAKNAIGTDMPFQYDQ